MTYRRLYIPLNLRFFDSGGAEKTEQATPKKKSKARDEGQVAKSQEISTAFMLLAGFFALRLFAGTIAGGIFGLFEFQNQIIFGGMDRMEQVSLARHMAWIFGQVLLMCAPMFMVGAIVGLITNIVQVGWHLTTKPLKPKFSKFNPIKGFKKIFSLTSAVNFLKSLFKLAIIGTVVFIMIRGAIEETMPFLLGMEAAVGVVVIGDLIVNMGLAIGALYLFIAALDYAYTRWKHAKDLRMTKHEVKQEHKEMDGDPQIKGKIRQKMREASMRRMMQNVPQADVIITNPTHYAVALKYDLLGPLSAPKLVAKGVDFVARRIKEVAIENNVHIVENPPLARAIYNDVELDKEIPEELYVAVAEIMAYVFQLKNKV
ncbi:MAG: flagellar biosynthesis protein FlhB [Defluviitaleaceae bacterium]|nr:flagellar biosynthesis protein FlhB [Defluviitaleaceae bacterium]MCL2240540.1 flagellar biosynthesis protein FlhB [Defluviitaleaceae bacterium]